MAYQIIGTFSKDKKYTIVSSGNELFALSNLKSDGTFDEKYECKELAAGLYGIGRKISC